MREYVPEIVKRTKAPRIMMVQAENDEVVSNTMAPEIKEIATSNKSEVDFRIVEGALHFDA
jgi:predicted esterase